jgi:hypothetical protein
MPTQRRSDWSECNPGGGYLPIPDLLAEDREILRLLCEQGAVPFDQLIRLACGERPSRLRTRLGRLEQAYCLVRGEFAGEKYEWLRATRLGARCVGMSFLKRPPAQTNLPHRRGIIEARLHLSAEHPGGSWMSEGDILRAGAWRKGELPDGLYEVSGKRWALEVELSRKSRGCVQRRVANLLHHHDKVIYYCAPHVLSCINAVVSCFDEGRLEVRAAVMPEWQSLKSQVSLDARRMPSEREQRLLRLVLEEGTIAVDQLADLDGSLAGALRRELAEMEQAGLVEQGFESAAPYGWVWSTSWGRRRSGVDLAYFRPPGPARLSQRRALMSIRLALAAKYPRVRWVTRRMLGSDVRLGLPREFGVLEQCGSRVGVTVSASDFALPERVALTFERLSREFDSVWWYCSSSASASATRLLRKKGWDNVKIFDLPGE